MGEFGADGFGGEGGDGVFVAYDAAVPLGRGLVFGGVSGRVGWVVVRVEGGEVRTFSGIFSRPGAHSYLPAEFLVTPWKDMSVSASR